jgi:hypothetical protein
MRASVDLQANHPSAPEHHQEILNWLQVRPFAEEIEGEELKVLSTALGTLSREQVLQSSAEVEAAAIIGWALNLLPHPPHDRPVLALGIRHAFGLENPHLLQRLLQELELQPLGKLQKLSRQLEWICARLQQCWLLPTADFVSAQGRKEALEIGVPLSQGDLSLQGLPAHQAPSAQIARCLQSLEPRRQALRWLQGGSLLYTRPIPSPKWKLPCRLVSSPQDR